MFFDVLHPFIHQIILFPSFILSLIDLHAVLNANTIYGTLIAYASTGGFFQLWQFQEKIVCLDLKIGSQFFSLLMINFSLHFLIQSIIMC